MTEPQAGVLDTNMVLLLDRLQSDALPAEPRITTITLAELSVGPLATNDPVQQALRQVRVQEAESAFDPLPFDAAAARAFGQVAAQLRRGGRRVQARAFDALIAATAIANNLPLYTCNPRDFAGIHGLDVVPVAHPDST
jgi:predicted nucleic acid-binding protein